MKIRQTRNHVINMQLHRIGYIAHLFKLAFEYIIFHMKPYFFYLPLKE